MSRETNELVVCREDYKTEEDFENAVKKAVMVLLNNKYIAVVRYDEPGLGIVAIEYQCADRQLGSPYPYFLSVDEAASVVWDEED